MPEYRAPGVHVGEVDVRGRPIAGVATAICAFVGPVRSGPTAGERALEPLTGFSEFQRLHGDDADLSFSGAATPNYLARAVRAYFDEGGRRLYVVRVATAPAADGKGYAPQAADYAAALAAAALPDEVSVLATPGATAWCDDASAAHRVLVDHAAAAGRRCFAVLDTPRGMDVAAVRELRRHVDSSHAAIYYPWVRPAAHAGESEWLLPPSGFVCGLYARTDMERGVHTTPANALLRSVVGLERSIGKDEQDLLNPEGVNCLRYFPGRGHLVWGARTMSSDLEWKYVNVRRYVDYLESSIDRGTRWVAFEPNGPALWASIRAAIEQFLDGEWRNGALLGAKPAEAWFVRCDAGTMTRDDIKDGRVVCVIGVALMKPAEFVVLRFAWLADTSS